MRWSCEYFFCNENKKILIMVIWLIYPPQLRISAHEEWHTCKRQGGQQVLGSGRCSTNTKGMKLSSTHTRCIRTCHPASLFVPCSESPHYPCAQQCVLKINYFRELDMMAVIIHWYLQQHQQPPQQAVAPQQQQPQATAPAPQPVLLFKPKCWLQPIFFAIGPKNSAILIRKHGMFG